MTGKKISESVKNDIIHLYRHTGETTSTLAERYGVSNSTISRLLKNTLAEDEYEVLIASKRAARVPATDGVKSAPEPRELEPIVTAAEPAEEPALEPVVTAAEPALEVVPSHLTLATKRQRRSTSNTPTQKSKPAPIETVQKAQPAPVETAKQDLELAPAEENISPVPIRKISIDRAASQSESVPTLLESSQFQVSNSAESYDEVTNAENSALVAEMLGEDLLDEAEDNEDLEDEDLDYLDDEDDEPETPVIVKRRSASGALVQVLPLSEASLPKTCYLVIDRASELITRPLREFGDLGQIPAQEVHQKTLPIFDNHRVARRFSTKRDRVIKIPDSRMLQKARYHLQAKGITRLLVDGQVYSLYLN